MIYRSILLSIDVVNIFFQVFYLYNSTNAEVKNKIQEKNVSFKVRKTYANDFLWILKIRWYSILEWMKTRFSRLFMNITAHQNAHLKFWFQQIIPLSYAFQMPIVTKIKSWFDAIKSTMWIILFFSLYVSVLSFTAVSVMNVFNLNYDSKNELQQ